MLGATGTAQIRNDASGWRAGRLAMIDHDNSAMARWCILRTSGSRTLALAASLCAADIEAWSPKRTLKRPVPGRRPDKSGHRPMREVEAPIIPTFVFVRSHHLATLASIVSDPASQHPAFSIFRHVGRVPLVGDGEVAGLKQEESEAEQLIKDLRDCESREAQRKLRAAAMRTERERRKAMRCEMRNFTAGQRVIVDRMSSMAGMTGIIESSDGRSAMVSFGGAVAFKIEAWQLMPNDLHEDAVLMKDCAA